MSLATAELLVTILGLYCAIGLIVGLLIAFLGLGRVNPDAKGVKTSVRLLFLPGLMALWPLMVMKWIAGAPAEEEA